jgi:hypothetical protein
MQIVAILKIFLLAAIDPVTLKLVGLILLILVLGSILNEGGSLRKINSSLEGFIRNRRLTLVFPSILMGLLPVAAGAMLSAPIVEESGNKMGLTSENKTFLNYWFRHIWEYIWPLYPGLILTSAIVNVPVQKIILAQLPLTLSAAFAGFFFGLSKISYKPNPKKRKEGSVREIYNFLFHSWPILAIILLVLILKLELILSLLLIVVFTFITTRIKKKRILPILGHSLSWKVILLVVSVMVFKRILETCGVLSMIPLFFDLVRISPLIFLFSLPLLIGFLTGVTQAFVGIALPLLLPFIGMDSPNLTYVMLAYAGGFSGVLLSPLHLCLIVTRDYFKADFAGVYKLLFLPVLSVILVAFTIVLMFNF